MSRQSVGWTIVGAVMLLGQIGVACSASLPKRVGECAETRVKTIENRIENTPGSGSAVTFENGGSQVSYEQVPAVDRSRPGDPVRMCLVSIPTDCPPAIRADANT
jgi:hypothetical protein